MPRFYSPEWVEAFNQAVAGLDVGAVDPGASLAAAEGRYRVAQVVRGVPEAIATPGGDDIAIVLEVRDSRVVLHRVRSSTIPTLGADDGHRGDAKRAGSGPEGEPGGEEEPVQVVVLVGYDDAAALSRGELDPASALGQGRIRVRGDLSVLVAGQAVLAAAAGRLADLQAATTY